MDVHPPSEPMSTVVLRVRMSGAMLCSANKAVIGQSRPLVAEAITRELIGRKNSREDIEATRGRTSHPTPLYFVSDSIPSSRNDPRRFLIDGEYAGIYRSPTGIRSSRETNVIMM